MSTILFDKAVFGPVRSRRLGVSLGVNLLPPDGKVCSFDCLYCECGFNGAGRRVSPMPSRGEVAGQLEQVLASMAARGERPDVITFAGNGEPTLHPGFAEVVADTLLLRDRFAPRARVCVLTNATRIARPEVADALCRVDEAILKIDSGLEETVRILDRPAPGYSLAETVDRIVALRDRLGPALTVQTMFVSWSYGGVDYDNTSEADVAPWLDILRRMAPPRLMIYTIERETPLQGMRKTPPAVLDSLARRARLLVPEVSVSY